MRIWRLAALSAMTLSVVSAASPSAGDLFQAQTCDGVAVTLTGTDGNDKLTGTEGPDVIHGGMGNDKILGLGGDDVLCGGEGADKLSGGPGDDHIEGNRDGIVTADTEYTVAEADTLSGGPGDDYLDGGVDDRPSSEVFPTTLTYAASETAVTVDLELGQATGEGTDTIVGPVGRLLGSAHNDELRGSAGDEYLVGNAGADLLDGRGGADNLEAIDLYRVHPETTPNTLIGGGGRDQLVGGDGNDILRGSAGVDVLSGEAGFDQLFGGAGDDLLNDAVAQGPGPQLLNGGPGDHDELSGVWFADSAGQIGDIVTRADGRINLANGVVRAQTPVGDFLLNLAAIEDVNSPQGQWVLIGSDASNVLTGPYKGRYGVVIHAGGGDDEIWGTFRHDVLDGGSGNDVAWPGVTADRIISIERLRY